MALLLFDRLESAAKAVMEVLPLEPSACDLMDRRHLSLAREGTVQYDLLIPPETEGALFNPFKRSSLHNPRNRTGMGLGLYIAQQIVREHEGEIAYRHEGGLVVFSVRLPLAPHGA